MSKKTVLLAGFVGYVLGARAGRERYEQIAKVAKKIRESGPVQSATDKAQEAASAAFREAKAKVSDTVKNVREENENTPLRVNPVEF
ncbi:hypothetical protein I6E29_09005 [Arcanobacterium haemolyticum]|nr:hypothetical protein [Arcanobacterium haemolyticum]